ncbi:hypothetical protein HDU76_001236, partial [Blyttiomyces sp. JEL0837]
KLSNDKDAEGEQGGKVKSANKEGPTKEESEDDEKEETTTATSKTPKPTSTRRPGFDHRGGSPFPSPTIHRRVLSLSNLKASLSKSALSSPQRDAHLPLPQTATTTTNDDIPITVTTADSMMQVDRPPLPPPRPYSALSNNINISPSSLPLAIPSRSPIIPSTPYPSLSPHERIPRSPLSSSSSFTDSLSPPSTNTHHGLPIAPLPTNHPPPTTTNQAQLSEPPSPHRFSPYLRRPHSAQSYSYSTTNNHVPIPPSLSTSQSELFGSLVGSYEESILSGRMSTLPSKPISFIAQVGVIGMGKCKPRLKCPPHINLAFPAYFYDLVGEESPNTPYVGVVDFEGLGGLVLVEGAKNSGGGGTGAASFGSGALRDSNGVSVSESRGSRGDCSDDEDGLGNVERGAVVVKEEGFRKNWPGGYRLPPKGQLQIIIKNPSRTAVKVFLVPYDFRDMPPNTKTFLRQKIYSVSNTPSPSQPGQSHNQSTTAPSTRHRRSFSGVGNTTASNLGVGLLSPSSSSQQQQQDRLRDAIHLQFYCTDRRRLYLTKSMRVVFSHRAPDGDEKQRPKDPKYIACGEKWMVGGAGTATITPGLASKNVGHPVGSVSPGRSMTGSGSMVGVGSSSDNMNTMMIPASSPTRRRNSFGVNMMSFAGISLADFSVSPVKRSPLMEMERGGSGSLGVGLMKSEFEFDDDDDDDDEDNDEEEDLMDVEGGIGGGIIGRRPRIPLPPPRFGADGGRSGQSLRRGFEHGDSGFFGNFRSVANPNRAAGSPSLSPSDTTTAMTGVTSTTTAQFSSRQESSSISFARSPHTGGSWLLNTSSSLSIALSNSSSASSAESSCSSSVGGSPLFSHRQINPVTGGGGSRSNVVVVSVPVNTPARRRSSENYAVGEVFGSLAGVRNGDGDGGDGEYFGSGGSSGGMGMRMRSVSNSSNSGSLVQGDDDNDRSRGDLGCWVGETGMR